MDNLLETADPREYLRYPTFGPLPAAMVADSGRLRCPCCGGMEFRLVPVCSVCGQTPEPNALPLPAPGESERGLPSRFQVVQGNNFYALLLRDGGVLAFGPYYVHDWSDITSIAAGQTHIVGLRSDGTVLADGGNYHGACNVSEWSGITAIAAGNNYTVGLRRDGTVRATGWNNCGQFNTADWSHIIAIAAGDKHTVWLRDDGTVLAVGSNDCGQCDTQEWSDMIAIAASGTHTVGLHRNGRVFIAGPASMRQDSTKWTDVIAIAAGRTHTAALCKDGTVRACGEENNSKQLNVQSWRNVVAIAAGAHFTAGLCSDGTILCTNARPKRFLEKAYA